MKAKTLYLLVAAAIASGCGAHSKEQHEDVRVVRTMTVGETAGSVGATYPGEIRARHESRLGFRAGGKVAARLVDVGAHVAQGQVLMRLDPAQEALQDAAARSQLEAAKSRLAQGQVDFDRTQQLHARRFSSQAELDKARHALDEAQAQMRSAEAQYRIAENQRSYTQLVADRAGIVTAIQAEAGQVVAAGTPVVTVVADGEREVAISVPEGRVQELRNAKRILITLWAQPGQVFEGALREMAPDVDDVSRTYAARIAIRNADPSIHLGMTASVYTPDIEGARAIRVPLAAVHDATGKPGVWIVDAKTSRVALRPVKVGAPQNDAVLVSEGLAGGEVVVTAGANLLHPGQKVKPAAAKGAV
jgi:multidrug efflux system membrane fusion protein